MLRSTRSRATRAAWAAALSCTAALLTWAPAQAGVTRPQRVSPHGMKVQQGDVAAGGGRTVVLMEGYVATTHTQSWSLLARTGGVRGLGAPVRLASGAADRPRAAVGADGTAVAAWTARPRRGTVALRVAVARPGHNFGRTQTLAQAPSVSPGGVAVTAGGRAVVAWRLGTSTTPVQVAMANPGHLFGATRTLGVSRQSAPAVTVAPDGTTVVAWLDTPPSPKPPPAPPPTVTTARVLAATLAAGSSRFRSATELSTLTFWFSGPGAASGPGGAAVTWRQSPIEQRLAALGPGGHFEPVVPLASAGPPRTADAGLSDRLALAIPDARTTVALWLEAGAGKAVVKAGTLRAGGAFSAARRLSARGWLAWPPAAMALPDRAVAAWSETRGRESRVRLAVRPIVGGWVAPAPLNTRALDVLSLAAAASSSYAVVTWIQDVATSRTSLGGGQMYLTTYRPGA